jgi:diguanylate cyclase (GGDEF)-like protein
MDKTRGLIIDDDRDLAKFLKIVLGLAGFECEIAHTVRAALNFLASNEPDLIFLDLKLGPDVQGSDLLYHIRSNPRFDSTRVIVITGHPALAMGIQSLADLVLIKPVEVDQLSKLASRMLSMEVKPYEFRDPLTGLYSLKFFQNRLELAYDRSKRREDFIFAILAVELEGSVSEGEDLAEGEWEQVMKEVAQRCQAKFRPTDTFGRLGHKQVIGLFEELKQALDVQVIAGRLLEMLERPVQVGDRLVDLSTQIGAVISHPGYGCAQNLLDGAIKALEAARHSKGMRCFVLEPVQRPLAA